MKTATLAALLSLLVILSPAVGKEKEPQAVSIVARILTADGTAAAGLASGEWVVPSRDEFDRLLAEIGADPGTEATTGRPGLAVGRTSKLSLTLIERVRYVQDYDVETGMGGEKLNGPIHGVIKEGVIADLDATPEPDGKVVVVQARVTVASVVRPIPEFTTMLAGKKVTIELPEIMVTRVTKTVRVPLGGGAVLPTILPTGGSTFLVITVDPAGEIMSEVGPVQPK